jgi:hypothetical protein
MLDAVDAGKEDLTKRSKTFTPEIHDQQDRQLITVEGGPAYDRTFAGMFNPGPEAGSQPGRNQGFPGFHGGRGAFGRRLRCAGALAAQWLDDSLPNEIVRPLATVWPMTGFS